MAVKFYKCKVLHSVKCCMTLKCYMTVCKVLHECKVLHDCKVLRDCKVLHDCKVLLDCYLIRTTAVWWIPKGNPEMFMNWLLSCLLRWSVQEFKPEAATWRQPVVFLSVTWFSYQSRSSNQKQLPEDNLLLFCLSPGSVFTDLNYMVTWFFKSCTKIC